MFDVFQASLPCPACGTAGSSAEIKTYIRNGSANGSALGVGFELEPVDLATESLLDAGYALVNLPEPGVAVRLLDVWLCRRCGNEQWAVVEIADGRIRAIEAVELDCATLESAHFIADDEADRRAAVWGDPEPGLSSVEILRRRLCAR
jgi:hypothetical protein